MSRRLTVRLPDRLAWGLEAFALRTGATKSEIVREALTTIGIGVPRSAEGRAEVRRRAAAFRERQEEVDLVALMRESRKDLERRGAAAPSARADWSCVARHAPLRRHVTPGFQEAPEG